MLAKVRWTVDWMRVWFAVSLVVFLITSSLLLYDVWGIGAAYTKGSWQDCYRHVVEFEPIMGAICASFLALLGFRFVFQMAGRRVLAAMHLRLCCWDWSNYSPYLP
jgi:hypothetical protein